MPDNDPGLDDVLHRAVLAGDEQAWRTWYDAHFATLESYVLWRCGGRRDLAEDFIQQTWVTALCQIRAYTPAEASFVAWLRGIAGNLLRNHFRKEVRRTRLALVHREGSSLTTEQDRLEVQEQVAYVLAQLPANYEEVLRSKYLEQQSVEEIAQAKLMTAKAVESLLTRARQALREALGDER